MTCQDIAGGEQSIRGRDCYCDNGNEYTEEGGCEGGCMHVHYYGVAVTVLRIKKRPPCA